MLFRARLASASLSDWGEAMLTSKVIGVRRILVESAGQEMVLGGTWDVDAGSNSKHDSRYFEELPCSVLCAL